MPADAFANRLEACRALGRLLAAQAPPADALVLALPRGGVPVGPASTCQALRAVADQVVCALSPEPFESVGAWYDDFAQTSDDEVRALLASARDGSDRPAPA